MTEVFSLNDAIIQGTNILLQDSLKKNGYRFWKKQNIKWYSQNNSSLPILASLFNKSI